jgi:hypothetical protein
MWRLVGQHAVPVALVAALVLAAPASAQLSPTTSPLQGSTFQGADGNQENDSPLIDWQRLQADGRVRHSPDPNPGRHGVQRRKRGDRAQRLGPDH